MPLETPKDEIESRHGMLCATVKAYLPAALAISVVSLNETPGGQMIMHHPGYDTAAVVRRLRLCADILAGTLTEENCPGHVGSAADPKICGICGTHIDSLRPDDGAP